MNLPGTSEVHIWRVSLEQPAWFLDRLWHCLDLKEQTRARQFSQETSRRQYIVSHGALRDILSRCLGVAPAQLRFTQEAHGKPLLAEQEIPLSFNLSHSGDLALIAVARGHALGIDIERIRPVDNWPRLAERLFSSAETASLTAMPEEQQLAAFFACWTRKEAYLKALGDGLAASALGRFTVTIDPQEPPSLRLPANTAKSPEQWSLRDVQAGERYAAALAMQGTIETVTIHEWRSALSHDNSGASATHASCPIN